MQVLQEFFNSEYGKNDRVETESCSAHFFRKIKTVKLPDSWKRILSSDYVQTDEPFVCLSGAQNAVEWDTRNILELIPKPSESNAIISPFDKKKNPFPLSTNSKNKENLSEITQRAMTVLEEHQNCQ